MWFWACGTFMTEGCGVATKMLEATRRGKADGMKYARQRLARVYCTSEGASGMPIAPCREMQRTMIKSVDGTASMRTPTGALRSLPRARQAL